MYGVGTGTLVAPPCSFDSAVSGDWPPKSVRPKGSPGRIPKTGALHYSRLIATQHLIRV